MKRTISFALIALMFLALFAGCNTYRRPVVTAPDNAVVDGNRVTRGAHNRTDGIGTDGRVHRGHYRHDGARITRGHYRHDGLITDTDGVVGNGSYADRPLQDANRITRRLDGARDGTIAGSLETRTNRAADGIHTPGLAR